MVGDDDGMEQPQKNPPRTTSRGPLNRLGNTIIVASLLVAVGNVLPIVWRITEPWFTGIVAIQFRALLCVPAVLLARGILLVCFKLCERLGIPIEKRRPII